MSPAQVTQTAGQSCVVLRTEDLPETHSVAASIEQSGSQVMHMFGNRVMIAQTRGEIPQSISGSSEVRSVNFEKAIARAPENLTETEELGLAAWNLRQSPDFEAAKRERPREGREWDGPDVVEPPDGPGMRHIGEGDVLGAPELAAEDMSPYLIGSVAVGIIMVEGPTPALRFSQNERTKVVAEVQEGLTWLGKQDPRASVTWAYDIHTLRVDVQPDHNLTGYEPLEGLWRNPAMAQLGFSPNFSGVRNYVASIRTRLGTRWGYVAYFTKYPLNHFAYASKPRLVMAYDNDGWGPDNIDRVFTHETGHIFGCPDEYSSSNCNCTSLYGYLQERNGNCERCASSFQQCLMASNSWAMCPFTFGHLGWRDTDGDGTLDPVDPVRAPQVSWARLCRRFPRLCESLGIHGLAQTIANAEAPVQDSVPLFLLRRVLTADQMALVENALAEEEDQYVDALAQKLSSWAKEIKDVRQEKDAAEQPPTKRRAASKKARAKKK